MEAEELPEISEEYSVSAVPFFVFFKVSFMLGIQHLLVTSQFQFLVFGSV